MCKKELMVVANGDITYSGQKIENKDLNCEFLYNLFIDIREDKVEYSLDEQAHISKLFELLREAAKDESLNNQIQTIESNKLNLKDKIDKLNSSSD